jgi:nicotinamide mononucleotide (NMN) deamidase PncC
VFSTTFGLIIEALATKSGTPSIRKITKVVFNEKFQSECVGVLPALEAMTAILEPYHTPTPKDGSK